jgi:hypothetical protein
MVERKMVRVVTFSWVAFSFLEWFCSWRLSR